MFQVASDLMFQDVPKPYNVLGIEGGFEKVSHNGRQCGSYPILSVPKRCRTCLLPNAPPSSGRRRRRRRKNSFPSWQMDTRSGKTCAIGGCASSRHPRVGPGPIDPPLGTSPSEKDSVHHPVASFNELPPGGPRTAGTPPTPADFIFYFVPFFVGNLFWSGHLFQVSIFLNNIFFFKI